MELASDHAFTAFLARCTPAKVLRDRSAMFSKPERSRDRYLRAKTKLEREQARQEDIRYALIAADLMRRTA